MRHESILGLVPTCWLSQPNHLWKWKSSLAKIPPHSILQKWFWELSHTLKCYSYLLSHLPRIYLFILCKIFTLSAKIAQVFAIFGGGHNGQSGLKVWSQNPRFGPESLFGTKKKKSIMSWNFSVFMEGYS